jgi:Ni,Fe-hydrogenase III small subunit/Pyruvate/2-oxoacid:ferredoxin oxidoreductase delta subunit
MTRALVERMRQGYQTMKYPNGPPPKLSERFRGIPLIETSKCPTGCSECAKACPTDAIQISSVAKVDLGRCLFCTECLDACPQGAIRYSEDYRLAASNRSDLIVEQGQELKLAKQLDNEMRRLFGRSLKLRQVSAGGCNACEADVNVLGTIGWDISRFGIQVVASPRHADGMLITGCVTENMKLAVEKTYAAIPAPKIVIAVGACAISGGPFLNSSHQLCGAESVVKVDLFIPGCPPHPLTILDGLLRLLGKIDSDKTHQEELNI